MDKNDARWKNYRTYPYALDLLYHHLKSSWLFTGENEERIKGGIFIIEKPKAVSSDIIVLNSFGLSLTHNFMMINVNYFEEDLSKIHSFAPQLMNLVDAAFIDGHQYEVHYPERLNVFRASYKLLYLNIRTTCNLPLENLKFPDFTI